MRIEPKLRCHFISMVLAALALLVSTSALAHGEEDESHDSDDAERHGEAAASGDTYPRLVIRAGIQPFTYRITSTNVSGLGGLGTSPVLSSEIGAGMEFIEGHMQAGVDFQLGYSSADHDSTANSPYSSVSSPSSSEDLNWNLGLWVRYNILSPSESDIIPNLRGRVFFGGTDSETKYDITEPDAEDGNFSNIPSGSTAESRDIGAELGFGLEYMFTSNLGIGVDLALQYTRSTTDVENERIDVVDGVVSPADEGSADIDIERDILSTLLTVYLSFRW